jgi:acyl-CoA hydrolase
MNLEFETTFTVMPKHCNYHFPMIFGGAFFSELDICAAMCVNRLLHDSDCDTAVTYKFEVTYHAAAESGDLIFMKAQVVELRRNAVVVEVKAHREKQAKVGRDFVADAKFVFVTKKDGKYYPHGLSLKGNQNGS